MAEGYALKDICENLNLKLSTMRHVTTCDLFVNQLSIRQEEIYQKELAEDLILTKLKRAAPGAVDRLIEERDSEAEDATANTRIKASTSILDRIGYSGKVETQVQNNIVIQLSETKLAIIREERELKEQPQDKIVV